MFAVIPPPPLSFLRCRFRGAAVSVCRRIRDLWGQAVGGFGRRGQVRSMPHMNILEYAYMLHNETEWCVPRSVY